MAQEMTVQRQWTKARARQSHARRVWARVVAANKGDGDYMQATIQDASDEPISHVFCASWFGLAIRAAGDLDPGVRANHPRRVRRFGRRSAPSLARCREQQQRCAK